MACLFVCLFNFAGNPHQSHSIEASWGSFKHSLALFFMTNSVIFQFIQTPDNASSKWHSWGTRLCSHGSSLVQKKSKLWRFICQSWGFLNCHRTGSFLTALEAENGFPARCTRDTEKRHLAALSLQLIAGYSWKNNPGSRFIFSIGTLSSSSQWRSIQWNILQYILYCGTVRLSW